MKGHGIYTIIIIFLSLTSLLSGCKGTPAIRTADETITIERAKTIKGFDLFLLIDESGSMSVEKGTDKKGLRHEAGKYLSQNLLVKESDPKYPNRISIIHFGDNALPSELIDLLPSNSGKITEAINFNQPKHLGDTSFINALKAVEAIHSKSAVYKNVRNKFIVIFTDGKPDDSRKLKSPQYFEELKKFSRENLKGFNIVIVGIDNSALGDHWSQIKSHWEDIIDSANLYSIADMRDLYTKFNEIVRSIYEIPGQTDVVIDEKSFEVTPYLEKIEFHVFPQPKVKLSIYKPDGTMAKGDVREGADYYIVTIPDPEAGNWKYKTEGSGEVRVLRNPIPFKLKLVEPGNIHPLGKPFRLKAIFEKRDGREIQGHPDFPLAFTAKIIAPDGKEIEGCSEKKERNIQFLDSNKFGHLYYANEEVKSCISGEYQIKLTVKGGTKFETVSTEKVFVQYFPYIRIEEPYFLRTYPLKDGLSVKLVLRRENKATEAEKEFVDHPNNLIKAQLFDSSGKKMGKAIWLNYLKEKTGMFEGYINGTLAEGSYRLALELAGTTRFPSELFPKNSLDLVDFYIHPDRIQWLTAGLLSILEIFGICILLWLLVVLFWLLKSPRITATFDLLKKNGETVSLPFYNCKFSNLHKVDGYDYNGESYKPLSLLVRARSDDTVTVYIGKWRPFLSMRILLSLGVIRKKRFNLTRGESYEINEAYTVSLS